MGEEHYDGVPEQKVNPPLMDPKPTLPEITHQVYIKVDINGKSLGRIVIGLFGSVAPKAVENFRALCACDHGYGKLSGKRLCYHNTPFHRVITNFMIQGGDITHGDGTGGESIYYDRNSNHHYYKQGLFEDEIDLKQIQFNHKFLVGMANRGQKNTNGSQFFITTVKTQWLNGNHVIFGTILEGERVVKEIEKLGTHGGKPKAEITIVDSGELSKEEYVEIY